MAEYENVLIKKTFDNNFFNVDNVSNSFNYYCIITRS